MNYSGLRSAIDLSGYLACYLLYGLFLICEGNSCVAFSHLLPLVSLFLFFSAPLKQLVSCFKNQKPKRAVAALACIKASVPTCVGFGLAGNDWSELPTLQALTLTCLGPESHVCLQRRSVYRSSSPCSLYRLGWGPVLPLLGWVSVRFDAFAPGVRASCMPGICSRCAIAGPPYLPVLIRPACC